MTGLVLHQFRYDLREFWREPAAVFFTVILPLIFLVLFVAIFGNEDIEARGGEISGSTYYLPGILALALVSATLVNIAITVTGIRERGWLKRVRATPVPGAVLIAGRALVAAVVALLMAVLVVLMGWLLYGVDLPGDTLPGVLLALVVGAVSLSALGFAFTTIIPSENAAPPVTNAAVLPLYFISGIFVPSDLIPDWMDAIAGVFPVKPLFEALLAGFDPTEPAPGILWGKLAIVAAWGVAGVVLALLTFRWTPRS